MTQKMTQETLDDLQNFHGIEWVQIKAPEGFQRDPSEIPYRKNRPPDRALVVSDGKHARVLDYIGPALDYWDEHESLRHSEYFDGLEAGIWIWEGTVHGEWFWTDYGKDYDEELSGEFRPLTKEEWDEWRIECDPDTGPWDAGEWVMDPRASRDTSPNERRELDVMYKQIDDLFLAGKFDDVDSILENLDVSETSTLMLVGYLTITVTESEHLKKRAEFFQRVKAELEVRDNRPGLWEGLE